MNSSRVEFAGCQCSDEGEGTPVVLLYGLFGSPRNFEALAHHLKEQHRVIVPIFPFYQADPRPDIFTLMLFVRQLTTKLGLERFHLLGNSMGGHIALLYTLKFPDHVLSLTLSGSSGLYENGIGDTYPRRGDYAYIKAKTELTFYDPTVATPELVDEIFATVNSRRAMQIVSLAKSTIRHNVEKELGNIKAPCCLIWGKNDVITPPAVAVAFQRLIPHAELHWIDECGHVPMMERPSLFNEIIDGFLERHELAGRLNPGVR